MKNWELTLVCTPPLKLVLEAVERTQLSSYSSEKSFEEIESALEVFFEELKEAKTHHYLQKEAEERRHRITHERNIDQ